MAKNGGSNLWKWLLGGAAVAGGVAWAVSASAKSAQPTRLTPEQARDLVIRKLKEMNLPRPVTIDKDGWLNVANGGKTDEDLIKFAKALLAGLRMDPAATNANLYSIMVHRDDYTRSMSLPASDSY